MLQWSVVWWTRVWCATGVDLTLHRLNRLFVHWSSLFTTLLWKSFIVLYRSPLFHDSSPSPQEMLFEGSFPIPPQHSLPCQLTRFNFSPARVHTCHSSLFCNDSELTWWQGRWLSKQGVPVAVFDAVESAQGACWLCVLKRGTVSVLLGVVSMLLRCGPVLFTQREILVYRICPYFFLFWELRLVLVVFAQPEP